ncbi:MAG: sigma 54-interacting transcriptional regulator [Deltaproteobacteria bacterium]|nr:sigma 54-interacting transcriptional regulator [Deltaproteobacteria bacterium]
MMKEIALKKVVDAASTGILSTDGDGRLIFCNEQASAILCVDVSVTLGEPISASCPKMAQPVATCLATGDPQLGQHIQNEGKALILDVTPIRENNRVLGAVCCIKDTNAFQQKQAALQLESYKRLNEQFETVFNASSDGIWVLDNAGTVIDVNQAAERYIGIAAEDVIGRNIEYLVENGYMDKAVTPMVLSSKRQVNLLQYVHRTQKYVLATGTPAFDENGEISLVVVNERDMTRLNELLEQLDETRRVSNRYRQELAELSVLELKHGEIIAESQAMQQVLKTALKLAPMEVSNILIQGESGTGKGLLAKFIHQNSPRAGKPFIQINCAALPENLLEAELFGYERGAFTGAHQKGKIGLFELAQGGTLMLDEIGDLPFSMQAKLLKCLEDLEIMHLGGLEPIKIDCIVIAATNQNLESLVAGEAFRKDLYYRLNTFNIRIPALRERPEDIFELANAFLDRYNRTFKQDKRLSYRAIEKLELYDFPGNVRELKNLIKKAVVMGDGRRIDDIVFQGLDLQYRPEPVTDAEGDDDRCYLVEKLDHVEMKVLKNALAHCRSTREMARYLGISQPSVVRKLKKHGLSMQ